MNIQRRRQKTRLNQKSIKDVKKGRSTKEGRKKRKKDNTKRLEAKRAQKTLRMKHKVKEN